MIRVFLVGVFDYFHLGHLRLFKNAKKLGDYLIVAVQDDKFIKITKPDACVLYSVAQRVEMVESVREVDEVVVYEKVEDIVTNVNFDLFVVGEDQVHAGFKAAEKWCVEHGKKIVMLPRTKGISSTSIKNELMTEFK